ncbi:MAG: dihydrodipicolinate synthase family protein [Gemmatimonadetes bacterium]|nr:dihydrodipicolinate synthase family protein [Gemmatimonadota bacterium]
MPEFQDWLSGVLIPVTTPFDPVTGEVAPVSMRENIRRWTAEPIDGIVLFGSTGEGMLLDEEEKLRLTAMVRDVMPGGLPLVAGAGAESTRATVRQAQRLAEAGADAVLVHAPPYFGPALSAAALRDHFLAVADASPVPVILYHIPKYAKVTLEPGLVGELARHPNIRGLKDSSGDVKRFAEYTTACGRECALFVGNGALLYTALELGAAGGIIAVGLLAPALCAEIVRCFRSGDAQRAGQLQERIAPVHREVVAPFGAPGLKAALERIGYVGGPPRAPLKALAEKERAQVARVMQAAGLLPE